MKGALRRLLMGAVAASLALAACAPPATPGTEPTAAQPAPGEAEPTSAPAGEPRPGGEIVLIIPEEPTTLNRYLADAAIVRQVADAITSTGLTYVDPDGEYQPALAAELPTVENGGLSEDLTTVTWRLREGLRWSDGEPITSADIVFTWETVVNPDNGAFANTAGFDQITSIETPDALTAIVTYASPDPGYLGQFSAGLLPKHIGEGLGVMTEWDWNTNPVGAGPFIMADWRAGESITLVRNPNYYEAGKPYLDQLTFIIVPDPAAQEQRMQQGEAQVQLWPGADKPTWDAMMGGQAQQVLVPGVWNTAIDLNLSLPPDDPRANDAAREANAHPVLGDLRVRQALAAAIDYDTLVNVVMADQQVAPSTNPFAYGWYRCEQARVNGFDLARAKQLLTEAGWVEGPDGIRVAQGAQYAPDGQRLTLSMATYVDYEPVERTMIWLQEQYRAIGVELNVETQPFAVIFGSYSDGSPRKTGAFDMLLFDRSFSIEPHGGVVGYFSSASIPTADSPDGDNYFRWVNPQADAFIEQAGATFDQSVRKEAYCGLAQLVQEDVPQIYLYVFQDGYGISSALQDVNVSTWGSMTWDVQNWWLNQ